MNSYNKNCNIYVQPRKMIAAGWQWATATKNIRRNKVHGEEEAKLVLDDAFEAMDKTTNETSMQGEMDVQDCK